MEEDVIFGIRGKSIPAKFIRDQLKLGTIIYVSFNKKMEPTKFSLSENGGGVKFSVVRSTAVVRYAWIATFANPQRTAHL